MGTVSCPVAFHAKQYPDRLAIRLPDRSITYQQLDRLVGQAVSVMPPSIVMIRAEKSLACILMILAAFRTSTLIGLCHPKKPPIDDVMAVPELADIEAQVVSEASSWALASPATIVWTSGSSSEPKGVVHSLENHLYSAMGAFSANRLTPNSSWLMSLPLWHVSGLSILCRCMLMGACIDLPGNLDWIEALKQLSSTHCSVVSTQLQALDQPFSLQYVLAGGSAIGESCRKSAVARGIPLAVSYGSTEMGSQIATSAVGKPDLQILPYRYALVDTDNRLSVGGSSLFLGYYADGTIRRECDAANLFYTRDLARYDGKSLEIIGRSDRMFISGGENIQPEYIESVLCAHPEVRQAVVEPVSCERFGFRPVAYVDARVSAEALAHYCRDNLPGFMVPDQFLLLSPKQSNKLR